MSYADFVTLLLACFATAYAASLTERNADKAPVHETAIALPSGRTAANDAAAAVRERPLPKPPAPAPPEKALSLRERLAPALAGGLDDIEIEMVEDARGMVISLPEEATFSSGSADLTPAAQALLTRVAAALRPTATSIRIEGHTDDIAVHGGRYRSNWELSTARASAVVVFMVTVTGFEPWRLSAAGYGEFHPRAANDGPEGRARNRRVDVVVIDSSPSPARQMASAR
jgi:chemotaxis protein MotB